MPLTNYWNKVNRVADDELNVARIHYTTRLFLQRTQDISASLNEFECVDKALRARGTAAIYDTPLRMLANKRKAFDMEFDKQPLRRLAILEDLLLSYGAKSLHLFPAKGLAGYVEEDMAEWSKLSAFQDANSVASASK